MSAGPNGRRRAAALQAGYYLATEECAVTWTMVVQAGQAARDAELLEVSRECQSQAARHAKWFVTRIKTGAPQALVVA